MTTFRFKVSIGFTILALGAGCSRSERTVAASETEAPIYERLPSPKELDELDRKDAEMRAAKANTDVLINRIQAATSQQELLVKSGTDQTRNNQIKALDEKVERLESQQQLEYVQRQAEQAFGDKK